MAHHVTHKGSCHCKAVQFTVTCSPNVQVYNCDCSICSMKRNTHFIVPEPQFVLVEGQDSLTTYTFNTHTAKHMFCKHCGVQAFYRPRSNPNGYAVTIWCIHPGTIESVEVIDFHGEKWEEEMAKNVGNIKSRA